MEEPSDWPFDSDARIEIALRARRRARTRVRAASNFLAIAAVVHVAAVPVALYFLKAMVDRTAGATLSWPQFFQAFGWGVWAFIAMVLGQFVLAFVAGAGASLVSRRQGTAALMVFAGASAIVYSFLVFGGIVGAIGGAWSVTGGVLGWQSVLPYPVTWGKESGPPPSRTTMGLHEFASGTPLAGPRGRDGRPTRAPPETFLMFGAFVLHVLAIPFSLLALILMLQAAHPNLAGQPWEEVYATFADQIGTTVTVGAVVQVLFAAFALIAAFLLRRRSPILGVPVIVSGLAAIGVSWYLFGGVFGMAGGALAIGAGAMARTR